MCAAYEISISMYNKRLKQGYSIEEALTIRKRAKNANKGKEVRDHLDNTYPSLTQMAKHYGLTACILQYRLDKGYTLEDALMTPKKNRK